MGLTVGWPPLRACEEVTSSVGGIVGHGLLTPMRLGAREQFKMSDASQSPLLTVVEGNYERTVTLRALPFSSANASHSLRAQHIFASQ